MSAVRLASLLGMFLLACFVSPSFAQASEPEEEREPRLILPGSHAVVADQLVALEWTPADGVRELEILLSLDGGRTYPIWISPRLSPGDCRFLWRVPAYRGRRLRMRIRYNRDGHEIEGAPSAALAVVDPRSPEPLGLPAPAEGGSRPDRSSDHGSRSPRAEGPRRQEGPSAPATQRPAGLADAGCSNREARLTESLRSDLRPAFVPLRV